VGSEVELREPVKAVNRRGHGIVAPPLRRCGRKAANWLTPRGSAAAFSFLRVSCRIRRVVYQNSRGLFQNMPSGGACPRPKTRRGPSRPHDEGAGVYFLLIGLNPLNCPRQDGTYDAAAPVVAMPLLPPWRYHCSRRRGVSSFTLPPHRYQGRFSPKNRRKNIGHGDG